MKLIVLCNCMYNGRFYRRGQVVDIDPIAAQERRNCFEILGTDEQPKDAVADDEPRYDEAGHKRISKYGLQKKLEELRVPYRPRDDYETLMKKYVEATSNQID